MEKRPTELKKKISWSFFNPLGKIFAFFASIQL